MAERTRYYKQDGTEYNFSKEPEIKITQTSNADMNIGIPKKLTAVEWLYHKLSTCTIDEMVGNVNSWFEQAKQMDKEQSIDLIKHTAMFMGASNFDKEIASMTFEDVYNSYYNETYEK